MIPLVFAAALRAFSAGNDLYLTGNYQGAVTAYETAARDDPSSPEIFYNLGNAFYKTGDMPHAVLYYEKALSLAPRYHDALLNLSRARQGLSLTEEEKLLTSASISAPPLIGKLTRDEAMEVFLSAYLPFAVFIFLTKIAGAPWKKRLGALVIVFGVLTLCAGILLTAQYASSGERYGILLPTQTGSGSRVELKEGPETSALSDASPSGGLKVRVLESAGSPGETWYKIELPGGRVGWVRDASLGLI